MVAACLVKDPKKRPSSEKLLKHPFFKHAKSADYVSRAILDGLSPLAEGFRMLKVSAYFICMLVFYSSYINCILLHYFEYVFSKDHIVHFPG